MISITITGEASEVKEFVNSITMFLKNERPAHEHKCGCGKEKEQPPYRITPTEHLEHK